MLFTSWNMLNKNILMFIFITVNNYLKSYKIHYKDNCIVIHFGLKVNKC